MGDDVRLGQRVHDEVEAEQDPHCRQRSARVSPEPGAALARTPEGHEPDADEKQTGWDAEESGVVVAGEAPVAVFVDGLAGHHRQESPDEDRERRPYTGLKARVGPGEEHEEPDLHEASPQVIRGRRPGLRLEEVVVDDVERADAERDTCEPGFGAEGRRDSCRGGPFGFS